MDLNGLDLDEAKKNSLGDVLENLRFDRLPAFASPVRYSGHQSTVNTAPYAESESVECEVLSKVDCGPYNAVLYLSFTDGRIWVLKTPAVGCSEDWVEDFDPNALESEAQTMRLIFKQFRSRALQGIAEAMTQLNTFTFDKCGPLTFDSKGEFSGIGPRFNAEDSFDLTMTMGGNDEGGQYLSSFQIGVFEDVKSYLVKAFNEREKDVKHDPFTQGTRDLLRLFIDRGLSNESAVEGKPFVLAHPDLDTQNIFTLEDGTMTGFIDWDWVAAVPHTVGCRKFPKFLTADCDPNSYDYDVDARESTCEPSQCSPEKHSCYRTMYARFVEQIAGRKAADATQKSLVIGSSELAATDPKATLGVVGHLFDDIEQLTTAEWDEMHLDTDSEPSEDSDLEDEDPVDKMDLEQLLQEIEKLTTESSSERTHQFLAADDVKTNTVIFDSSSYSPWASNLRRTTTHFKTKSHARRLGFNACRWGAKGFRHVAECLYRVDADFNTSAQQPETPAEKARETEARKPEAFCALYRWAQEKLKRIMGSLHCRDDLEASPPNDWFSMLGNYSSLLDVVGWSRKKLDHIMQFLQMRNLKQSSPAIHQATDRAIDLGYDTEDVEMKRGRVEKAACKVVAGLLQEITRGLISKTFQTACVRWMVKNIRPLEEKLEENDLEEKEPDQILKERYHNKALGKLAKMSKSAKDQDAGSGLGQFSEMQGETALNNEKVSRTKLLSEPEADSFLPHHQETSPQQSLSEVDDGNATEDSCFPVIFPNHNRVEAIVAQTPLES